LSLARAVAWNSVVQVGGRAVGLTASLTFNAILIRHLGIATFGQFTAAAVYVGFFMILGESGLYLVSVRRAMQEPEQRARILGTALGLRLLWTLVPLGLAFLAAQFIPTDRFPTYQPEVKLTIGILALNEYLRLLCQFLTAVFRMHLRMDLAVLGEVGSRLVALGGILLLARTGGGLLAVGFAFLVANGANLAYAWVMARRLESFRPQLERSLASGILRESVVVAGVLILSLLRVQIGTLLLSLLRTAEEVGIYGVATKVHEVLVTFPGLLIALLYPVLSKLFTEGMERLRRTFQRTFDTMLLVGLNVSVLVLVLAPHMAAILGEPRATIPMRVLALALPSVFLGMSFSHLVLAEGRQGLILRLYLLFAVAALLGNVLLIPRFSYLAVATLTVVMETGVLVSLAVYWLVVRGLSLQLRSLWGLPLASLVALLFHGLDRLLLPGDLGLAGQIVTLGVGGILISATFLGSALGLGFLEAAWVRGLLPVRLGGRDSANPSPGDRPSGTP
jgi:O-antigen/teichoic acid export membrane protein